MKVQIVNPYRVSHLQRYGVTVGGNVTRVYPPLGIPMRLYKSTNSYVIDTTVLNHKM
jgi:hypothetical protein